MFDVQKYIHSGAIEAYCLELAEASEKELLESYCIKYPLIREALIRTQKTLIQLVGIYEKPINKNLAGNILERIESLEFESAQLDQEKKILSDFLPISKYSRAKNWQTLVKSIEAPTKYDVHTHTLFKDSSRRLYLVWIKEFIEEAPHGHMQEQFFILEGTCTCLLDDQEVHLSPGSFIDVPVNRYHNLKVTSKQPIKMIIAKRKVA